MLPLDTTFRLAFSTTDIAKPNTSFTSPFLKVWRDNHRRTCPNHGESCHAWRGLQFGNTYNNAYFDIECLGCGEHYIELAPKTKEPPCEK